MNFVEKETGTIRSESYVMNETLQSLGSHFYSSHIRNAIVDFDYDLDRVQNHFKSAPKDSRLKQAVEIIAKNYTVLIPEMIQF